MKESIHKYFKLGTLQWMSFPNSAPLDALTAIARDDFFDAVEIKSYGAEKEQAKAILDQSHLTVCFGAHPMQLKDKLNPNALDESERQKAEGALKGAIFAANLYERLGFRVVPNGSESRHDIIQAVELGSAERMLAFCKGIQAAAPVDSYVTPVPWAMPGYDSEVVMAAGAFVQGSSIELSADGPIRPPYAVYFQGGLTWYHAKLGILMSLQKLVEQGLVAL